MDALDHLSGDTIIAWAGGASSSPIGIVRLSGADSHRIASSLSSKSPPPRAWTKNHPQAFFTKLQHPGESRDLIDSSISLWYRAPDSYTGEDMVEFSIHGNPLLGQEVVEAALKLGARLAAPGEFTERAFLNGKIDLTEAEAVQELIASKSRAEIEYARKMIGGALRRAVEIWYAALTGLRAKLEVIFDYPGEGSDVSYPASPSEDGKKQAAAALLPEEVLGEEMLEVISGVILEMDDLLEFHDRNKFIREGVRVAIAGAPNVGKSSLFNALAGFERAITDESPGTTRDYLETTLGWERLTLTLVDTAGLRESPDSVEAKGVERSRRVLSECDVVLHVVDTSEGAPEDAIGKAPEVSARQTLVHVLNKIDLLGGKARKSLEKRAQAGEAAEKREVFLASALTGEGIGGLRSWLVQNLGVEGAAGRVLINERHRSHIERARAALEQATYSLKQGVPTDIVTIDIAEALKCLAAITGREPTADLLDTIFSGFCVGK